MDHDEALRRSRFLRRNMTDAERLLWAMLRNRGLGLCKFRRQVVIGEYIVDFVCIEGRLVVELDGIQHAEQQAYDADRTRWLEGEGFRVLRFWNEQLLEDAGSVAECIRRKLQELRSE